MRDLRLAVVPLRVLLATFFLGLVVAQVMSMPGQFRHMAQEDRMQATPNAGPEKEDQQGNFYHLQWL